MKSVFSAECMISHISLSCSPIVLILCSMQSLKDDLHNRYLVKFRLSHYFVIFTAFSTTVLRKNALQLLQLTAP